MEIGSRLKLGFLAVALLVLVVGYISFDAIHKIKKQSAISDGSRTLLINVMGMRKTLHAYLLSEDPAELSDLDEKHETYGELAVMWLEALSHGSDSAEFRSKDGYKTWVKYGYEAKGVRTPFHPEVSGIAQDVERLFKDMHSYCCAAMDLHSERLAAKAEFEEKYLKEKGGRYAITDRIHKTADATLIRNLSDMRYYSNEALFQYRDETHIDKWLESIKRLRTEIAEADEFTSEELSVLSTSFDEYYTIAQTLLNLALELSKKESDGLAKLALVDKHIAEIDAKIEKLNLTVTASTHEAKDRATAILMGVVPFSIVLALTIAFFISRSISKPLARFRDSAIQISQGNLNTNIEMTSNDEIGQLASTFNEMAWKLRESYAGLEEQVRERTEELKNANKELEKEITERKRAEEEIQRSYQSQTLLNRLLHLSLQDISMKELLEVFIKEMTSIPWFALESKGAVFLVEDEPDVLVLKAQRGLDTQIQTNCARLPFGRCLCGRAALSGKIEFADCVGESHDIRYEGMPPHGHYCVPILSADEVLGVVTLYVTEQHRRNQGEEAFLRAACDVLAGIIRRKQAEEALRVSRAQHRDLVETVMDWIWEVDANGVYTYVSPRVRDVLGYEPEEVLGKTPFDLMPPEEAERVSDVFTQVLAAQHPIVSIENTNIHKDGHLVVLETNGRPFFDVNGILLGYRGVDRDITERKKIDEERQKLERQLLQSEKMASVGQLAAGVAHEINNPTGFVSSNLNTLKDYQDDVDRLLRLYKKLISDLRDTISKGDLPSSTAEQVEQIVALETEIDVDFILDDIPNLIGDCREGTERIKNIVLNMKDFAHPGEDKLGFADINKGLESTLNIVWNELKYKATVTKDYGDLPEVQCYPQQLNQVFMNILVNAAQAIEKEGEIKIATRAIDGKVEINISDTGAGIPKENLSKIFDPFFTSKEVGKGTGLGLNVAHNIIEKHQGTIDVESTVGKGTTFTIRIPLAEAEEG